MHVYHATKTALELYKTDTISQNINSKLVYKTLYLIECRALPSIINLETYFTSSCVMYIIFTCIIFVTSFQGHYYLLSIQSTYVKQKFMVMTLVTEFCVMDKEMYTTFKCGFCL